MEELRRYIEGDYEIIEYTKDGETVSHKVEQRISAEPVPIMEPGTTVVELIYAETTYQTALLEVMSLG